MTCAEIMHELLRLQVVDPEGLDLLGDWLARMRVERVARQEIEARSAERRALEVATAAKRKVRR